MPNLLGEVPGLVAFVRTVAAGSFSAAARDLKTTPSAISKSVGRLEKKIGVRLFLRSTRAVTLTQDGEIFFEHVAPLLRNLDASDEIITSRTAPTGRLRISMPGELAPLLLPELFSDFAVAYPDLHLDIGMTDRFVNLVGEDYDVALRAGNPTQGDLMVRRLANLPMIVVGSPSLMETWGRADTANALAELPFARFVMAGTVPPLQLADGTSFVPSGRVDCDSGTGMIQAAASGLGAAHVLRCLVADQLEAGTLVDLAPKLPLANLPFNALHAFGRTVPLRVKLFCDFVAIVAKRMATM